MSQICSLVSVDLAAGCIDFVSICIFLPAKNTFISSTNIDAEKTVHSLFTFCCVGRSTMAVFLPRFMQGFLFSLFKLKTKNCQANASCFCSCERWTIPWYKYKDNPR